MSKKSRRRNKKILAALALAGGAAMMAKRKGSIADMDDAGINVTHPAATAKNWITKKAADVAAPAKKWISPRMFGHGAQAGDVGQKIRAGVSNRVTDVVPPFPTHSRIHKGRGVFKSGGSAKKAKVTGAAKRGFGRALMKGKK